MLNKQPSVITVGAIFFENQNACLKSPRMHQSSKSLCPSLRGVPEDSRTSPTCQVWMILSRAIAIERKLLFSKIGLIDQFRKAVFVPLRFLLFSWLILIRKMTSGGVLESSGSPLVDGHRDFQNRCRNG